MNTENATNEGSAEVLETLARRIERCATPSEEHMLEAARLVREARRRVKAGDAGEGVTWSEWSQKNIRLGKSQLRLLLKVADAPDPNAELGRQRRLARKRASEHRNKKRVAAPALEPARMELVTWAEKSDIADVRQVLEFAKALRANGDPAHQSPKNDAAAVRRAQSGSAAQAA